MFLESTFVPKSTFRTTSTIRIVETGQSSPTDSSLESGGGSGLNKSDRIALGVGLGLGIPSLIVGIATCMRAGRASARNDVRIIE
jgi:hypothetical protein